MMHTIIDTRHISTFSSFGRIIVWKLLIAFGDRRFALHLAERIFGIPFFINYVFTITASEYFFWNHRYPWRLLCWSIAFLNQLKALLFHAHFDCPERFEVIEKHSTLTALPPIAKFIQDSMNNFEVLLCYPMFRWNEYF